MGETERRIAEQDECCSRLEAEIASARREVGHLGLELDQNNISLEKQLAANAKLQEDRRRLLDDLDDEALKQRHRTLDIEANQNSARSDLSTACTVRDLTSPGQLTGRSVASKGADNYPQTRSGAITAPPMVC